VRQPLSPGNAALVKLCSFLLPLALWCAVSYVPFVWHPDVKITDPGDSEFLTEGQQLPKGAFAEENAKLTKAGEQPAKGLPANPIFLPAPHEVAKALVNAFTTPPAFKSDPWLHQSLWKSVQVVFWSFLLSAVIAVPVGILAGTFEVVGKLTEPFTDFVRYMPPPAFGPLMIAVFGIDDAPKIAIIFIGTFFPLVLVVANTTRLLDPALIEAAQTLGASRRRLLTRVVLPGVLPNVYNDLRIALGVSWVYLTVAQLIGATSGISWFINQQGKYRHFDNVFAGILVIGLIGLVTDQVLQYLARFLFPYQAKPGGAGVGVVLVSAARGAWALARTAGDLVRGGLMARDGAVRRQRRRAGEEVNDVPVP
jgi:NitT/TauT family transport system permease protein